MKKTEESPILKKEIKRFLEANPKIKDSLDLFKISEEQYLKAMQSMEPRVTTSNKIEIEIEA